jgi:hypothetical protein
MASMSNMEGCPVAVSVTTVNDVLDGYVQLDISCLDRIYLNGYVPNLQVGGQVVTFLTRHLGKPVPSPAIFEQIGDRFRRAVSSFIKAHNLPVIRFGKDDRKIDVMRPYQDRLIAAGGSGVAAIGVAQEFQSVWTAYQRDTRAVDLPQFSFVKATRRVSCYYFYVVDEQFGPGFVKICSYFPYPIKVWVNGHEWAKRQATQAGIGFVELSNGFAACADPAALQCICDRLGPTQIQAFCHRWLDALPTPLSGADEVAGYWWEFSMRQIETSRTIVFDAPRHARSFFEALIADNLDMGRPDTVEIVFGRQIRNGEQRATPGVLKTKVVTRDVDVTVNAFTATPGSSSTSKTAGRCASRPSSTHPPTCGSTDAWSTSTNCRARPVRSTPDCWTLSGSVRAVSLRAQPSRGSRSPPSRRAGGPRPCGSATLGSWPWPAPWPPACTPSPVYPTTAFAPS